MHIFDNMSTVLPEPPDNAVSRENRAEQAPVHDRGTQRPADAKPGVSNPVNTCGAEASISPGTRKEMSKAASNGIAIFGSKNASSSALKRATEKIVAAGSREPAARKALAGAIEQGLDSVDAAPGARSRTARSINDFLKPDTVPADRLSRGPLKVADDDDPEMARVLKNLNDQWQKTEVNLQRTELEKMLRSEDGKIPTLLLAALLFVALSTFYQDSLASLLEGQREKLRRAKDLSARANSLSSLWSTMPDDGGMPLDNEKLAPQLEFMRQNNIQINGKTVDEWLKQKSNYKKSDTKQGLNKGAVKELQETLASESQSAADASSQYQTKVNFMSGEVNNCQTAANNLISSYIRTQSGIAAKL